MKVDGIDGVTRYTLRQSDLNSFLKCPEQYRQSSITKDVERSVTDAMAVGTAMHTAIETWLGGAGYFDSLTAGYDEFERIAAGDDFRWVQVKRMDTALQYVRVCFEAWVDDVWPHLGNPVTIEQFFHVKLAERGGAYFGTERVELWIEGTWDLYDDIPQLWDWKTAGRYYEAWEYQRNAVQPTFYTYAWQKLYEQNHGEPPDEPIPFVYAVMLKGAHQQPAQLILVERDERHWSWLAEQLWGIVDLYEMSDYGARPWPKTDQGWLCSEKWCGVYAAGRCKGAHMLRATA